MLSNRKCKLRNFRLLKHASVVCAVIWVSMIVLLSFSALSSLQRSENRQFQHLSNLKFESSWQESIATEISIPGYHSIPNTNQTIYVMNTMYLPEEQLIAIFLPGKRHWSELGNQNLIFTNLITNWTAYEKQLYCAFKSFSPSTSKAAFMSRTPVLLVPNTLISQHKESTQVLLCQIPSDIHSELKLSNKKHVHTKNGSSLAHKQTFILHTTDLKINVRLSYNTRSRTTFPVSSRRKVSSAGTLVSVCLPRVKQVVPQIVENLAYYFANGIGHIYVGTFFDEDHNSTSTEQLINLTKPWYDRGQVTFMNFQMPRDTKMRLSSGHFLGQEQFTMQCLYLAKSFGDEFTLNVDMDEYVIFHQNNHSIQYNLRHRYYNDIKNKCWTVFNGYDVWKLTAPNSSHLTTRYTEINVDQKALSMRCKTLWNNKYLWSAEVHAGGACSMPNNFNFHWNEQVKNYRTWFFGKHSHDGHNPSSLVKIMNASHEASIRHYINAYNIRNEYKWIDQKFSFNDSEAIYRIIWKPIQEELQARNLSDFKTFDDAKRTRYRHDVLHSKDYISMYGNSTSDMNVIVNPKFNRTVPSWRNKFPDAIVQPAYKF